MHLRILIDYCILLNLIPAAAATIYVRSTYILKVSEPKVLLRVENCMHFTF